MLLFLLMENKGENWWTECVSDKIRKSADSRKAEEDKIKWHTHRGTSMINYVDFADLANIMGQNYDLFEVHISLLSPLISLQNRQKCRFEPTLKKCSCNKASRAKKPYFKRLSAQTKRPETGTKRPEVDTLTKRLEIS